MIVFCKTSSEAEAVARAVTVKTATSRFRTADRVFGRPSGIAVVGRKVRISGVRLRRAKPYCGNHLGPCVRRDGKHRRMACLEGGDWVGFVTLLNDALDAVSFDGRVVSSSRWILRKGRKRRLEFYASVAGDMDPDTEAWNYEDCIGKTAPPPTFPDGTPGLASYDPADEEVE